MIYYFHILFSFLLYFLLQYSSSPAFHAGEGGQDVSLFSLNMKLLYFLFVSNSVQFPINVHYTII